MGTLFDSAIEQLPLPGHVTSSPCFTRNPTLVKIPEVCRFQETILQTAIRRHLLDGRNLAELLKQLNLARTPDALEILGEKALTHGHIDLLLKERVPLGAALKVPMEVKLSRAQPKDVLQLRDYIDELAGECPFGILAAAEFSKQAVQKASDWGVKLVRYRMGVDLNKTPSFDEICQSLVLETLPD